MKNIKNKIIPVIFIGILTAISLMYVFVPDEKVSEEENRTLAAFPKFTWESLWDGSYTLAINDYMTDQFPMRKSAISLGDKILGAMSLEGGDVQLVMSGGGDMGEGETLAEIPRTEEKKKEKPKAAKIDLADEADYNSKGIILVDDRAMELFGFTYKMTERYAAAVNGIKSVIPDVNVYSMLVPTSVEFYSPLKYHETNRSQKQAIETMYSMLAPSVTSVDAYTYLAAKADKYIYFRTDHHWTVRGAYEGYYAFCEAAGLEAVPAENFNVSQVEGGFLGTLYRYTKKQILKDNPDFVEVFDPPEVESCVAYTAADMSVSYDADVIVNPGNSTNKYLTFLGGDNPLLHIVTKNKNGKKVLIIKDSFGNAFTPFLINHYEEIFVLDPRATQTSISEFCTLHGITDVIIENYNFSLGNSEILGGLESLAK